MLGYREYRAGLAWRNRDLSAFIADKHIASNLSQRIFFTFSRAIEACYLRSMCIGKIFIVKYVTS